MNLHEEIAKVAYELYLKSGCVPGRDSENWHEAERIVLTRNASQDIEEPEGEELIFADKDLIEEVEGTGPMYGKTIEKESKRIEEIAVQGPAIGTEEDIEIKTEKIKPPKRTASKGRKETPKKPGQKSRKKYH
jgi:hypothetical protein